MSVWVLTYPVERERKGESRERERKETRNAGNSTSKAAKEVRARFLVFRPADICPGHLFVGSPGRVAVACREMDSSHVRPPKLETTIKLLLGARWRIENSQKITLNVLCMSEVREKKENYFSGLYITARPKNTDTH